MHVLYFGPARERAGVDGEQVSVDAPIGVDGLWNLLLERHPGLAAIRSSCRIAIDMHYASADAVISPGSEVAIIPPVAGG